MDVYIALFVDLCPHWIIHITLQNDTDPWLHSTHVFCPRHQVPDRGLKFHFILYHFRSYFITDPLLCRVWFFSSARAASRKPHESSVALPTSVLNLFQSRVSNSGLRLQRCVWFLNYSSKPQRQKARSPDFAVSGCKTDRLPPFAAVENFGRILSKELRITVSVVGWEMISWIVWKSWLSKICKVLEVFCLYSL